MGKIYFISIHITLKANKTMAQGENIVGQFTTKPSPYVTPFSSIVTNNCNGVTGISYVSLANYVFYMNASTSATTDNSKHFYSVTMWINKSK